MSHRFQIAFRLLWLSVFVATARTHAQDMPAYTGPPAVPGFHLPRVGGTLSYAVSVSEAVTFGYDSSSGRYESTNLFGDLAYLSGSPTHPFSLIYSGGYLVATSDQPSSPLFQNLAMSQVLILDRWNVVLSDGFSYLPSAPVIGLSGVPGLGDVGIPPVQVDQSDASGLLSNYGTRISNTLAGSASRSITNRTSLTGSANMAILRFPGSSTSGLESNQESGTAGISHALSARTSILADYSYGRYTYPAYSLVYNTQTGVVGLSHQWTKRLSTSLSVGPQYSTTAGIGGTLSYTIGGNLGYQIQNGGLSASYSRGDSNGQGIATASESDNASGTFSHTLGYFMSASTSISYSHTATLPISFGPRFSTNSLAASVQLSRSLTRTVSAFASYTAERQILGDNSSLAVNALNGVAQTLGFGLTYSPTKPITVGH